MEEKKSIPDLLRSWAGFLQRQDSPFKVNILKNLAKNMAVNLTYQYQPIYIASLGATPLVLGYINSLSGAVNTLLAIPTGVLADRVGIKKVLLLTLGISIISSMIFGFARSLGVMDSIAASMRTSSFSSTSISPTISDMPGIFCRRLFMEPIFLT